MSMRGILLLIVVLLPCLWLPVFSSAPGTSGSVTQLPINELKAVPFKTVDGKEGWQVNLPGNFQLATPCVVDGMVYIGGGFGSYEFYAFDAQTGRCIWRIRVNDDGPTAAVVEDGYCVFNTESCTLFVVDAKTGNMVWSKWLGDPLMSQPALAKGRIYMAYPGEGGHRLACFNVKDGHQYWNKKIAGDIISAPVVDREEDLVYLTTFDGMVYCYETGDGTLLWSEQYRATSAPSIVKGQVYVSQREGEERPQEGITSIDKKGNIVKGMLDKRAAPQIDRAVQARSLFEQKNQADSAGVGFASAPQTAKASEAAKNVGQASVSGLWGYQGSRPTVVGDYSFASRGDTLQMFDLANNKTIWEHKIQGDINKIGGHLASPPAVVNGKSVIGTVNGEIICFDNATGKQEWIYKIDHPIRFQPAVVDGRIYVGTTGGQLVCVDTGNKELTGWAMWGGDAAHNGPLAIGQEEVTPAPVKTPPPLQGVQASIPLKAVNIWIGAGICVPIMMVMAVYLLIRRKQN